MIRRRKLLIISIVFVLTFLATTNYLLTTLTKSTDKNRDRSVQELIYLHFDNLPSLYKTRKVFQDNDTFIKNINSNLLQIENVEKLWEIANSWVSKNRIVDFESPHLGSVLQALKKSKIIKADLDSRGTQLKFLLTLEGHQNAIFKPKWYAKERVIEGPVYAGKDRYNSEIIAFYLSAILNLPLTPCSVERKISLTRELIPVSTKRLVNTSYRHNNRTCVYGSCFYCKKEDPICEDANLLLTGAVIFNINASLKSYRSPWQRTYKKSKKAVWEESDNYCRLVKAKLSKRRLLDLIDVSIFDFFIQNGDRHHYETLYDNVILLDNGKGFGNPNISHLDILAPLYQCCILRSDTWKKLQDLAGGNLRRKLETLPNIENLLTEAHLEAMEQRLLMIFATVEYCRSRNKAV